MTPQLICAECCRRFATLEAAIRHTNVEVPAGTGQKTIWVPTKKHMVFPTSRPA